MRRASLVLALLLVSACPECTLQPTYEGTLLCEDGDPFALGGDVSLTLRYIEPDAGGLRTWVGSSDPRTAEVDLASAGPVKVKAVSNSGEELLIAGTVGFRDIELRATPHASARYDLALCAGSGTAVDGDDPDGEADAGGSGDGGAAGTSGSGSGERCANTCSGFAVAVND